MEEEVLWEQMFFGTNKDAQNIVQIVYNIINSFGSWLIEALYRVEVTYNEQLYVLHNKQVFESVDTGDTFEINLVEEVDKNENIIDSYLEVISTRYK